MVRKEYMPKIHLMCDEEMTECGIKIKENIHATCDENLVTCANCARTLMVREAEKKKYPYMVLTKTSVALHIGPGDIQSISINILGKDIMEWYEAIITEETECKTVIQEKEK